MTYAQVENLKKLLRFLLEDENVVIEQVPTKEEKGESGPAQLNLFEDTENEDRSPRREFRSTNRAQ